MSDYLWDKSGAPDQEIEHLEAILGELRYQPQALEIPRALQPRRHDMLWSGLAVAAALALVALAGLGLRLLRNDHETKVRLTGGGVAAVTPPPGVESGSATRALRRPDQQTAGQAPQPRRTLLRRDLAAKRNQSPVADGTLPGMPGKMAGTNHQVAQLTREEQAAKEQLILALRLASAKLNLAQRKMHEKIGPFPRS
jgi:hypothetical protein